MNQDPAENFFGDCKSMCYRNNAPTTQQFGPIFRTALIKNLSGKHSIDDNNCMPDQGDFLITWDKHAQRVRLTLLTNDGEIDLSFSYDPKKVPFRSKSIMFPPLSDILKDCSSKVKNCTQCFEILKSVNCVNTLVNKYQECKLILIEALPNVFHMPRIVARLSNELMKKVFFNASIECSENHIHAHQIFSSCLSTKYILSVISYLNRVMDGKVIVNETERLNSVIKMAHDIHLKTLYKKNRAIVKPTNA
ncbi:hypothetical protein QAD02_020812 [Eretmocerus hayati]|uniref:Uncharacterized protein n=1 Tax=Eretmocerus hayati TaxID=131215 RepID=A0ACC2PNZ1_9HYME|nr:hypothetical protein QAD02_020812 [Eretmocerus hayati]